MKKLIATSVLLFSAAMSALLLSNPNPTTTTASNDWLSGKYVLIS